MADPEKAAAILARALEYPYATPDRSYLYRDAPPPSCRRRARTSAAASP